MGVKIAICVGVGRSPVTVGIRVGEGWRCRGACIVLKSGRTGHITEHTLLLVGLDLY